MWRTLPEPSSVVRDRSLVSHTTYEKAEQASPKPIDRARDVHLTNSRRLISGAPDPR